MAGALGDPDALALSMEFARLAVSGLPKSNKEAAAKVLPFA